MTQVPPGLRFCVAGRSRLKRPPGSGLGVSCRRAALEGPPRPGVGRQWCQLADEASASSLAIGEGTRCSGTASAMSFA